MGVELEKLFGSEVLEAFDERVRRVAEEVSRSRESAGCVKVKTAARLLDMNESRVRALIGEGRLRVINPTPRTIRIPLSEIRRFTEEEL